MPRPFDPDFLTRIGGESGLSAILNDLYNRLARDVLVGFFFDGKDLSYIAAQQKAFLLRAMGATQSYSGKPPGQAHHRLPPILLGHFDRRLRVLEETLASHGLSSEDIRSWVQFEETFRRGITGRKEES